MSEIDGISNLFQPSHIQPTNLRPAQAGKAQNASAPSHQPDKVEISSVARFLSQIASMPGIRQEKVESLRNALLEGAYNVNDHLADALENLLQENQI